jgi:endonuclease YncB( thermonuclease family)
LPTVSQQDRDRYGRIVATCTARDTSINAWLVKQGWAVAYRKYGGNIYNAEETTANRQKVSI